MTRKAFSFAVSLILLVIISNGSSEEPQNNLLLKLQHQLKIVRSHTVSGITQNASTVQSDATQVEPDDVQAPDLFSKVSILSNFSAATFVKRYTGPDMCGTSIIQLGGGKIAIAGITLGDTDSDGSKALLTRVTSDGLFKSARTFNGSMSDIFRSTAPAGTGFLVSGETQSFGFGDFDAVLIKASAKGGIKWERNYGTSNTESFTVIIALSNGNFRATGLSGASIIIVDLDPSGNIVSQHAYNLPEAAIGWGIAETSDGGSIVLAENRQSNYGVLLATDRNGNVKWAKGTHKFQNVDNGLFSLAKSSDGNFFAAGNVPKGSISYIVVSKLNESGATLWTKKIAKSGKELTVRQVSATNDGGCVLVGQYGSSNFKMFFAKLSANGQLQWSRIFSGGDESTGYAALQAADGTLLVTGCASYSFDGELALVKVSDTGSVDARCSELNSLGVSSAKTSLAPFGVNLSTASLSLQVGSVPFLAERPSIRSHDVCVGSAPACGNGRCESGENSTNCPQDCSSSSCDPCYTGPGVCVPTNQGDVNCSDIPWTNFHACSSDPDNLDGDGDGIACETGSTCGNGKCDPGESASTCPKDCPASSCHPCYTGPGVCVPSNMGDIDCPQIPWRDFHACPSDPYNLDGDGDGIACES